MNKTFFAVLGILFILGILTAFTPRETFNPADGDYNREYWLQKLASNDPHKVYEEFKKRNAQAPLDRQHLATHVFGETLFEELGSDGVSICDSTFSFGCFHGFFTYAVSEEGIAIVPEFNASCVEAFTSLGTGCLHGIGHGIMDYFGPGNVNAALETCEKDTTQVVPLIGCTSGVFMEYHSPVVISEDSARLDPRPFDSANPYEPCEDVPERFRTSCYFELGFWWYQVLGADYEYMGDLCRQTSNDEARKHCFLGVGSIATQVIQAQTIKNDVLKTLRQNCSAAGEGNDRQLCLSGASWLLYTEPSTRELAPLLCKGLPPAEEEKCLVDADFTEGLDDTHL